MASPRDSRMSLEARALAALAELDDAEARTKAAVGAAEHYATELREFRESLPAKRIQRGIEAGLGTVIVDGAGELITIKLDMELVSRSAKDILGRRILAAIRAAERDALKFRKARLDRISKSAHLG